MISERIKHLEKDRITIQKPFDFETQWADAFRNTAFEELSRERLAFAVNTAVYERITFSDEKGRILKVRYIRPCKDGRYPVIVVFSDYNQRAKGWQYLTRFSALGYAVLGMEHAQAIPDWREVDLKQYYRDCFLAAQVIRKQPELQKENIVFYGEGLGGTAAIAAAAMLSENTCCMVLNPLFGDRGLSGKNPSDIYESPVLFAPLLKGQFLMGTCLMDEAALPFGQYAIYHGAVCEKKHVIYPKHAHERVNFFEDEVMKMLHMQKKTGRAD